MAIVMFQIHVKVKPDKLDEFMEVALLDARETVKETGNLRFEVYRRQESPTELVVFEIYVWDNLGYFSLALKHYNGL